MAVFSMSRDNVGSQPSINWSIYWSNGHFYISCTKNADGYISGGSWTCYLTVDNTTYNFNFTAPTGGSSETKTSTIYLTSVAAPTSYYSVKFYTTSTSYTSTGVIPSSNPITGVFYYNVVIQDRVGSSSGTLLGSQTFQCYVGYSNTPSALRTTTYTGYTYSSDSGTFTANADKTVYRYFTANTYVVLYNANGISGDTTSVPVMQTKTHNIALTLSSTAATRYCTISFNSNGGSSVPSLTSSRTFQNWNTASDGSGTSYGLGASYTTNASATMYAQWNGSYATISLPAAPTKSDGSLFKGWYTDASGGTRVGGAGSSYTPSGTTTLYAQWDSGLVRIYHGTGFITYIPYIFHNGSWVRSMPYVYKNGSWKMSV